MTPTHWSIAEDILPWLAFTAAMVTLLRVPTGERSPLSRDAKVFFSASIVCYMAVTTGSVLKNFGMLPDAIRPVLAALEVLWVPFVLFGVYSMYSTQQLNDARAASDAAMRTGQMAEEMAETSPAGIIVLSDSGHIVYANHKARELFELLDGADAPLEQPQVIVHLGRARERVGSLAPKDLSALLRPEPLREETVVIESHSGRRRRLSVNTSPYVSADGGVGGALVSFVELGVGYAP